MPGLSGVTVVTMLVCFLHLHARLRVHRAPGIPCALCFLRASGFERLGRIAPRECGVLMSLREAKRPKQSTLRHSGMVRRTRPGISRFRARCFASPRNDGGWIASREVY